MKYLFFTLILSIQFTGFSQVSVGLNLNKNTLDNQYNFAHGYGLTFAGFYTFSEESRVQFQIGADFSINNFWKKDYYSNTDLMSDPSYQSNFNKDYNHSNLLIDFALPLSLIYSHPLNSSRIFIGVGVAPRIFLYTKSKVSKDQLIYSGQGLRLSSIDERINIEDRFIVGYKSENKFGVRFILNNLLLSQISLNELYYRYTDKTTSLTRMSLQLTYEL